MTSEAGAQAAHEATYSSVELKSFGSLLQPEVRIDDDMDCASLEKVKGMAPPRLGLACMSKGAQPNGLSFWLHYHRMHLGVERFFLRIEEAVPATRQLLSQPEWAACVDVTFVEGMQARDCGSMQTARQDEHVQRAIQHARRARCTHLLHIDDDELVYLPHGLALLHAQLLITGKEVAELERAWESNLRPLLKGSLTR